RRQPPTVHLDRPHGRRGPPLRARPPQARVHAVLRDQLHAARRPGHCRRLRRARRGPPAHQERPPVEGGHVTRLAALLAAALLLLTGCAADDEGGTGGGTTGFVGGDGTFTI